jgi:hypothetical protein
MADNFWARKLGVPAPPPEAPAAAPAAQRAWWRGGVPEAISPAQASQEPDSGLEGHDLSRATNLKEKRTCPECQSDCLVSVGSVTTVNGSVEALRCFICGWPAKNSTQHMSDITDKAKVEGRTRQVASGGSVNNYHPEISAAGAIRTQGDLRRF